MHFRDKPHIGGATLFLLPEGEPVAVEQISKGLYYGTIEILVSSGKRVKLSGWLEREDTDLLFFENIFKEVDYLISPTTPTPAFKFGEKTENPLEMYMSDLCTIPANLAGIPAISIPTGLSKEDMPLSIQLMSPARTDSSLLEFSETIEKLLSFNQRTLLLEDMK